MKQIILFSVLWVVTVLCLFCGCQIHDKPKTVSLKFKSDIIDHKAPTPGGKITLSYHPQYVLKLEWQLASDNITAQKELYYRLYYSTNNDNKNPKILLLDWKQNISSFSLSGLKEDSSYYFYLQVKDNSGNSADYLPASIIIPTDKPPLPGNSGQLKTLFKNQTRLSINWDFAKDDMTPDQQLEYKVVLSTENTLGSIDKIEANIMNITICQDWKAGINHYTIGDLKEFQEYYINVLVRDKKGNQTVYKAIKERLSMLGDVDKNNDVDYMDAYLIAYYDVEMSPLRDPGIANVNGDLKIDIVDALVIVQYLDEIVNTLGNIPVKQVDPIGPQTGALTLKTDKETLLTGENVNIDIFLDSGNQKPAAFHWEIEYDPKLLNFSCSDISIGSQGFIAGKNLIKSEGRIIINGFQSSDLKSGRALHFLNLKAKALSSGKAVIRLRNLRLVDEKLHTIGPYLNKPSECSLLIIN